jgi:uncharacterized protein
MVVLDEAIVTLALPAIKTSLHFSQTGLQWVLSAAYTLSYGELLLLGGRAGDLLGRRRVLVAGYRPLHVSSKQFMDSLQPPKTQPASTYSTAGARKSGRRVPRHGRIRTADPSGRTASLSEAILCKRWHDLFVDIDEVSFIGAGVRLSGCVMLPDASSECPGLVLIGGSGPSDRHNGGFFDLLRDDLVRSGVAVLAYDKRGAGRSTGSWETATIDELATDAGCACALLRDQAGVAHDAVGVLGHSEGGWVALRLCAGRESIACLILNSCPAVSFIDAEVFALTRAGASPTDAEAAGALFRELAEAAQAEDGYEQGERIVAAVQREMWYSTLLADGFVWDHAAWAQIREWGSYDPLDDLNKLRTPTLVVLGADDPLVPVRASAQSYRDAATNAGRAQQIAIFPDANHRLLSAKTGAFAPGYLNTLSGWVKKHGRESRRAC